MAETSTWPPKIENAKERIVEAIGEVEPLVHQSWSTLRDWLRHDGRSAESADLVWLIVLDEDEGGLSLADREWVAEQVTNQLRVKVRAALRLPHSP